MDIKFTGDDLAQLSQELWRQFVANPDRLPLDRISYTEIEAAKVIGMAKNTLRDLREAGAVKAKKLKNRWYYTRKALLELMEPDE